MESDLSLLQGCWVQIRCNSDGVDNPIDEFKQTPELIINGKIFSVFASTGEMVISGTFDINPMAHPKSIDWADKFGADKGKIFPSIYTLSIDEFVFCAANEDMERPTSYDPKYGHTIRCFKRK